MVLLPTGRLLLREFILDDAPALNAIEVHPDVARWVWLPGPSLEDTRRTIEFLIASAAETPRTIYTLAIVTKADDRLIGRCGFDITGPESTEGVVGYAMHRDYWGQGYMTEAVRALAGLGFGKLNLHRVWAEADPRNIGSWRVLGKVGMRREGHLIENAFENRDWCDSYIYAILDREWEGASRHPHPDTIAQ